MFASLKEDIKYTMKFGNMVNKVIIVNFSIWLVLLFLKIVLNTTNGGAVSPIYQDILEALMVGKDPVHDLIHPWVWITHMFTHEGFFHLLWNMLFLFWFGRITGDLIGDRRMLPLYLLGGISGAIVFLLSAHAFAFVGTFALGASAAVTCIVFVGATLSPDYVIRLFLLGNVQIKWIAFAMIIFDLISIANVDNTGGHLAHLGGAAFGYLYAIRLRQGNDLTQPLNQWWDRINTFFKAKQRRSAGNLHVRYKNEEKQNNTRTNTKPYQEKLDEILDKIKQSGYNNLTEEEKEFLFQASKKP